jgi:hypothetical protein
VAAHAKDGEADHRGEYRDHHRAGEPGKTHPQTRVLGQRPRIGAEAEKRGGGEGGIAGIAADEVPGQRERAVHREEGSDLYEVIARDERHRRKEKEPQRKQYVRQLLHS